MDDATVLRHGRPEDVGMDPERIERIRARARGWVEEGITPSLVLLVARKGVIVLEEAYGILRPSDGAPLQVDSIFPVGSISKPFTAAALMCLVEDGRLSLKHPITDYIPEITTSGADQVLIADLLTHTSGWDDADVLPLIRRRMDAGEPLDAPAPGQHALMHRILSYAADAPLVRAPGATLSYCNHGFNLLGDIVRRVSGQPLWRYAQERLFAPLGMRDSGYVLPAERRERRVLRRRDLPDLDGYLIFPSIDDPEFDAIGSGSGSVTTTARDLAAFGQMLLNGGRYGDRRILSRASVAAMTSPQVAPGTPVVFILADGANGTRTEYPVRGVTTGYGLIVLADDRSLYINGSLASPRTYAHTGVLGSFFWVDPDAEVVGVYLSVQSRWRRMQGDVYWKADHFQDMVHAVL
jgi:CubicO group peptidase (beta-lactamase class C family)